MELTGKKIQAVILFLSVQNPGATQLLLLEQVHRKGSCFQSHAHHRNQQLHAQCLQHIHTYVSF
jgi:hypothetical protein